MSQALGDGQQPAQLPTANDHNAARGGIRPLKPAAFQSAIVNPEPVVVPLQDFQLVPLAVAEHKQTGEYRQG